MVCPVCRSSLNQGKCTQCGASAESYDPLLWLVVSSYNRSLRLLQLNQQSAAWNELWSVLPVFPFVKQILEYCFELSLVVTKYSEAAEIIAWLTKHDDPEQTAIRRDQLAKVIEVSRKPETADGAGPFHEESTSHTDTAGESTGFTRSSVKHWLVGLPAFGLVIMFAILWWSETQSGKVISSQLTESVLIISQLEQNQTQLHDSLALIQFEFGRISDLASRTDSVANQQRDLLRSNGPHFLYHLLHLNVPDLPTRLENMQLFVELYPDLEVYSGFFLRELCDNAASIDSSAAAKFAMLLQDYCLKHPELSYLLSNQIKSLLK